MAAFALFLCRPQQLTQALPFTLLILLLFCNMFCCGLVNTVQSILIADAADLTEKESGIRRDGIFVSGQSLLIKLSTGVSALLQGLVFAISGFSGTAVRQINRALYAGADFTNGSVICNAALRYVLLFLCLPGIAYLLSALPYRKAEIHIRHLYKRPLCVCSYQNLYKKRNPYGLRFYILPVCSRYGSSQHKKPSEKYGGAPNRVPPIFFAISFYSAAMSASIWSILRSMSATRANWLRARTRLCSGKRS